MAHPFAQEWMAARRAHLFERVPQGPVPGICNKCARKGRSTCAHGRRRVNAIGATLKERRDHMAWELW
eukprot:1648292-Rhodomonas_salina.1